MIGNFLDIGDFFKDSYIPGSKLIQTFEYRFGEDFDLSFEKQSIVILCYNLYVDAAMINYGGNVTIFCRNVVCEKAVKIDVSGKHNAVFTGKKPLGTENEPNGQNADNTDLNGNAQSLDGGNGGTVRLFAESIQGSLEIIAAGGRGAKGQEGGDAINNRDGAAGPHLGPGSKDDFNGQDGFPPTDGGDGAKGGNGGKGGAIVVGYQEWLFYEAYLESQAENQKEIEFYGKVEKAGIDIIGSAPKRIPDLLSASGGQSGIGGEGGKPGHGGHGGAAGSVEGWGGDFETPGEEGEPGKDRSGEIGTNGRNGDPGTPGESGSVKIVKNNLLSLHMLPSSYFRVLILSGENLYINNDNERAREVFEWILSFKEYLKNNPGGAKEPLSVYLSDEELACFEPFFSKADLYLNQISHGFDFFGNATNYVTILDNSFYDDKILHFKGFVEEYEEFVGSVLSKTLDDSKEIKSRTNVKAALQNNIGSLNAENVRLVDSLRALNNEIRNRLNEIPIFKQRIFEKEAAFRQAIENANQGCDLQQTLTTITKIVSIAVSVYSVVGTAAALATIASQGPEILSDFNKKYEDKKPGFDMASWNKLFNEGGDNSLVKRVEKVQKAGESFEKNVKLLGETHQKIKDDKQSLVSIPTANVDDSSGANRNRFVDQMKDFIGKYPEAKVYRDEVLSFFDFCDITNQKRLQFTSNFFTIMQNQSCIETYENDLSSISGAIFTIKNNEISSEKKWMFLDSYLKMKQFYLKLIYLHTKSINFLTLKNSQFSPRYYDQSVVTLGENYQQNLDLLIDYINSSDSPQVFDNFDHPIVLDQNNYPISFAKFKNKEVNSNGRVTFYFSIPIDAAFLDGVREIRLTSAKVLIKGAKTDSGEISFTLIHSGNSTFIKADDSVVTFSHALKTHPLRYKLSDDTYDDPNYIFGDFKSPIKSADLKPEHHIGISPFANWGISINPKTSYNQNLDLSQVSQIEVHFEYESVGDI